MKKVLIAVAAIAALPATAQAQSPLQPGGFYIGAEGGANWLFNTSPTSTFFFAGPSSFGTISSNSNLSFTTGFVAGGALGYDFIGLRVEAEGVYRENNGTLSVGGLSAGLNFHEVAIMGNVYYDFLAGSSIVPYIGAGAGVAFLTASALGNSAQSTQFAYQGILGVGWNIDPQFRLNLEGRYFGTTTPNYTQAGSLGGTQYTLTTSPQNNNVSAMLSLHMRFFSPPPPPPPPPPVVTPPSFMVFFDWDRSNLSQQALTTIGQAAAAFKSKGNARITATGHTDTSGPEAYNMALSLRRANAVKDALVRNGVPAQAITVIGRGEQGLLVQTGDNVREPQNRRVEIVIQ